jgi:hypothetical protein
MNKRGKIDINGIQGLGAADEAPPVREPSPPTPPPAPEPASKAPTGAQADPPPGDPAGRGSAYDPSPRRPKSERKNAFHFGSWLLEGVVGVAEELQHNDLGLPEEFWVHAYNARKEALLAVRALVDAALEQCDADESNPPRQKKSPSRSQKQRGQVDINFG